jgi:CheY-specific phosphatase CheX
MQISAENSGIIPLPEAEMLNRIKLKMGHLFSMKERERLVLGNFINSEVLSFNKPAESVKRYELTYQLDLIGSLQGRVLLNLDEALAASVASALFGGDAVSVEDSDAAMKELLNIFAGHMATAFNELGIDLDIATPEKSEEDFLAIKEGRRILFRFACLENIIQFVLILKN